MAAAARPVPQGSTPTSQRCPAQLVLSAAMRAVRAVLVAKSAHQEPTSPSAALPAASCATRAALRRKLAQLLALLPPPGAFAGAGPRLTLACLDGDRVSRRPRELARVDSRSNRLAAVNACRGMLGPMPRPVGRRPVPGPVWREPHGAQAVRLTGPVVRLDPVEQLARRPAGLGRRAPEEGALARIALRVAPAAAEV